MAILALATSAGSVPANAQAVATQAAPEEDVVTLEKFSVSDRVTDPTIAIGTDTTRSTISITREALLSAPAGISGLKMLESLPGFNVQTSDALGLYEFGNSVFVRAFNYAQIGFVLDGVPMGRVAQFGGSPIYRYVDNENLGRVTASAGSGEVSSPSYSSLGPIALYSSITPSEKPGALVAYTRGSNDLTRTFIKGQSGKWHGLSGYVSYSDQGSDQWRGPGTFDRKHWEGKVRYDVAAGSSLQLAYIYNDYFDYDSPAISLTQYRGTAGDIFGRSGRYFAYLGTVPNLPETTTGIKYSNPNHSQYFKQAINSRTDKLYSLSADHRVNADLKLDATVYYEDKLGYGVSPENYQTSLTNYNAEVAVGFTNLFAPKGLQYGLSGVDGERTGLNAKGVYQVGINTLVAGFWVEKDEFHRTQARYNQQDGNPDGTPLRNEPVHLQRDFKSQTDTRQLFLKDTIKFPGDQFALEIGIKALDIDYVIKGARNNLDYRAGIRPRLEDNWRDDFLPQVGGIWKLGPTEQLFASYAENMARPVADDVYSQASLAATSLVAAEQSKNFEVGIRTNRSTVNGSLAAYATRYRNRLQTFSSLVPGSTQVESFYQNVGRVEAYGFEFSGGWRPTAIPQVAFNGGVTYNHAEFKDNYTLQASSTAAPAVVAIAGKETPDSPRWILQYGTTWRPLSWLTATVSGRYLAKRYSNFINTEEVSAYAVYGGSLELGGERFAAGPVKGIRLRLNVDNIFDRDYLGTVSASTTSTGTFRPGPDRTLQVTLSGSF